MNDLARSLEGSASENIRSVVAHSPTLRLQVLVSEVVNGPRGKPVLCRHGYRVGAEYFYPASSIKLCAAIAALQKLDVWQVRTGAPDLLAASMQIDPLFPSDASQTGDPLDPAHPDAGTIPITVGREVRKLALVSDNRAFNRLFDLVGHEDLNRAMHSLGLPSVVLNHRLSETRAIPDPLASAAVRLMSAGREWASVPARTSAWTLTNASPGTRIGAAYWKGETLVDGPMDFTARNGISITDLQNLLVLLVRPDLDLGLPPLVLTEPHRAFLIDAMTRYPRESDDPRYPATEFPDEYSKFLLPGVRRVFPSANPGERIEITGKVGRAYGFSIENAYLRDPASGRAVFVTVVLYTNADGILNDDKYEYDTVADPFLADLGEWVARRWLQGR